MKTIFKKIPLLLPLLAVSFIFTSCDKNEDDEVITPQSKTITDMVISDNRFTILEKAVVKAGLAEALSEKSSALTVFAPTDEAFTAFLSTAGFANIEAVPVEVLKPVLMYHVLGSKILSSAVETGYAATISPIDTSRFLSIFIEKNTGVKINNSAMVTQADVQAENGVIHVIDKVLVPLTVGELVAVNPQFSTLAGAVVSQKLLGTLSDKAATFTIFAPTNEAFTKHSKLPEDVTSLLLYHVMGTKMYSNTLKAGYANTLSKFGDFPVSVNVEIAPEVKLNNSAKVVKADIAGTNGVIHIIDNVIFRPSVVEIAQQNPNFSILVEAVIKAGLAQTLSGAGPFTVFAPTNEAFNALFQSMGVSGINALTKEALTPILLYHVVGANVRSEDLSSGQVTTLNGPISVSVGSAVSINQTANVVATDIQGANGVVHVLDKVLMPPK